MDLLHTKQLPNPSSYLAKYLNKIWLNDCPNKFKPVHYKRYVDNTFILFRSPHHLETFNEYLNTKHANITFTNKKKINRPLQALDIFAISEFLWQGNLLQNCHTSSKEKQTSTIMQE